MKYLLVAIALVLSTSVLAQDVQIGPGGVRVEPHYRGNDYDRAARHCREMGGYMRHGQCRYSHRNDHNGDRYYGGQRHEDY